MMFDILTSIAFTAAAALLAFITYRLGRIRGYRDGHAAGLAAGKATYGEMLKRAGSRFTVADL